MRRWFLVKGGIRAASTGKENRRYDYHPVCADLQAKILQCYRENTHQTLSCSALANQYMHCVNHAKQAPCCALRERILMYVPLTFEEHKDKSRLIWEDPLEHICIVFEAFFIIIT
ncbi:Coiled-coil-helix-coiled-coil-helix domain-containing protein 3, mitochondrial [Heterocephalus glaber]|uniref:Coiled-coil-helix-coiled-coil-helix domain-containing protein 3, mitochondrial n=1 Tax=Heterocephalus glaber TaxID=10181 RepID=G5C800_HETGA|nr:Coiled-coil-helix-coiled-coil-helix domain-containing protein 3, mitochondrial [Heterocephalus glaber]